MWPSMGLVLTNMGLLLVVPTGLICHERFVVGFILFYDDAVIASSRPGSLRERKSDWD